MAAMSLYFESPGIDCKPSIEKEKCRTKALTLISGCNMLYCFGSLCCYYSCCFLVLVLVAVVDAVVVVVVFPATAAAFIFCT